MIYHDIIGKITGRFSFFLGGIRKRKHVTAAAPPRLIAAFFHGCH